MAMVRGNNKLGKDIWHWSLPADKKICTTASDLCASFCYAKRGHYRYDNVQASLWANYDRTRESGFVSSILDDIRKNAIDLLRMHASGEFYEPPYVRKWIHIASRARRTLFFGYTRSWRKEPFIQPLTDLAKQPNVRLWLSSDRETGPPPEMLHTRVAYMQVGDDDIPQFPVDLVFRTKRKPTRKRVSGVLVCPVENGTTKTTCQACRLCIDRQYQLDRINEFQRVSGDSPAATLRTARRVARAHP